MAMTTDTLGLGRVGQGPSSKPKKMQRAVNPFGAITGALPSVSGPMPKPAALPKAMKGKPPMLVKKAKAPKVAEIEPDADDLPMPKKGKGKQPLF